MKHSAVKALIGAVALIALLAAMGCGSGEGGESPPSKAAFIRKGNIVCSKGVAEKEGLRARGFALRQRLHGRIPQKRIDQFLSEQMDIYEREAEQLAALVPPAGDEKKIQALVIAMKKAAAWYRANPESGGVPFGKPGRMAQAYGLDKCIPA